MGFESDVVRGVVVRARCDPQHMQRPLGASTIRPPVLDPIRARQHVLDRRTNGWYTAWHVSWGWLGRFAQGQVGAQNDPF